MRYVTSIERLAMQEGRQEGIQEGIQEGRQKGIREMLLEALEIRFGGVSDEIRFQLEQIEDSETLRMLLREALSAESLAAFEEGIGT